MAADRTAAFAATLVDEWARAGVTDAVVAPGSRSAPLTLALARDERLRVHVVIDERSAAFFALGLGRASGRPAVLCCTSGSAGAHFHPAVIEADLAGVPMIVATANRPPELLDTGAGQTIDQHHLFGGSVRWFAAPGPPAAVADANAVWRSIAARAAAAAVGPPAGPVHLDLAFREPLVSAEHTAIEPGRADGRPWTTSVAAERRLADGAGALAPRLRAAARGLVVVGWGAGVSAGATRALAERLGWPVLADSISSVREGPHAISTYDALLRDARFATSHRPDLVLRFGAPLTSKVATAWLDPAIDQIVVDPDARWLDPHRAASARLAVDPERLVLDVLARFDAAGDIEPPSESPWLASWRAAERAARGTIDEILAADDEPFDARVGRDVFAAVPHGGALLVASSMPVRDLEWFAAPRTGLTVHANRGANGIDGLVATTLGIAAGTAAPTVALLGDLAFVHDSNGLLAAASGGMPGGRRLDATFVVCDNGGGGIFHFLPPSRLPELDRLFVTPHGVDLVALTHAYGVDARRVERASEVGPALAESLAAGGPRVLVVPTDRERNVGRHEAVWAAVAASLP